MQDDSTRRRNSLVTTTTTTTTITTNGSGNNASNKHVLVPRSSSSNNLISKKDRHFHHHHSRTGLGMTRYAILILGVGAATTFFLQTLNLATTAGNDGVTDTMLDSRGNTYSLFTQRQLSGGSSTSRSVSRKRRKNSQYFGSIAEQVREQIELQRYEKENNNNVDNNSLLDDDEKDEDEMEIPYVEPPKPGGSAAAVTPNKPPEKLPDFSTAPPARNLTSSDHFSACLLIKDDNHWLIEWLAYHYHVMPLRHLIVAIDPDSQTTPRHILKRWENLMTINVWTDNDYLKDKPPPPHFQKAYKNNTQLMYHRHRQNTFFVTCLKTLKNAGRKWVYLTDTDEFIAINYASGPLYNLTKHHPIQQPGSVLRFLNHHQDATKEAPKCIFMPRYMFGSKESSKGLVERNVPKKNAILKGSSFLTQRYMFRHPKKMQNGKNLIHLEAIEELNVMANVHRVSSFCPTHETMQDVNHIKKTLVKVHHYLGSKDQYLSRTDPRGDKSQQQITKGLGNYHWRDDQRYEELDRKAIYSDSGARGWIAGFVKTHGVQVAEYLLKGIGQVGVE